MPIINNKGDKRQLKQLRKLILLNLRFPGCSGSRPVISVTRNISLLGEKNNFRMTLGFYIYVMKNAKTHFL